MDKTTRKIALFSILTALALVLGFFDNAIPLNLLFVQAPGIKLGLANIVLVFAVYTMDWKSCVMLMLTKVFLSGFLFQTMTMIMYSLAGGTLSLAVMLLVKKRPQWGALVAMLTAAAVFVYLRFVNPNQAGENFWATILAGAAGIAALGIYIAIVKGKMKRESGTSLAGAVAHNTGQILVASLILNKPELLEYYLPVLVGIGGVIGCLTGMITERVLKALNRIGISQKGVNN